MYLCFYVVQNFAIEFKILSENILPNLIYSNLLYRILHLLNYLQP